MNRKWFICDPPDFPYNKEIIIQEIFLVNHYSDITKQLRHLLLFLPPFIRRELSFIHILNLTTFLLYEILLFNFHILKFCISIIISC